MRLAQRPALVVGEAGALPYVTAILSLATISPRTSCSLPSSDQRTSTLVGWWDGDESKKGG